VRSRPSEVGDRGTVTAEVAVTFPVVVLALTVVLLAGSAARAGVACMDGARAAARALAAGEQPETAVSRARSVAGGSAVVTVEGPSAVPATDGAVTAGLVTVEVVVGAGPVVSPPWVDRAAWRLPVACAARAWVEPGG
jgi:hypothetical protein